MHNTIRTAREELKQKWDGATQDWLARKLITSVSTVRRIETDPGYDPTPEKVADMVKLLKAPHLKPVYCNKFCELGRRYEGEFLNGLSLSPQAALLKLVEEIREVKERLPGISKLLVNVKGPDDLLPNQREELAGHYQHILDVQRNIEHLSLCINPWLNLDEQVDTHNKKCRAKRYILPDIKKEPVAAGPHVNAYA